MAPLGGLLTRPMRRLLYRGVALFVAAYFLWRPSADALRWLFGTSSVSPFRSRRANERGNTGGSAGALSTGTDDETELELPLVTGPVVTPPSLVWVLLGEPFFQDYFLESITQARIFNPTSPFFLVADVDLLTPWADPLKALGVTVVHEHDLDTDFSRNFSETFLNLWWVQLRGRVGKLEPTMKHRSNMNFSQVTLTRLVHLYNIMDAKGLERVVHVENDQMLYGPISAVADAGDACGSRLAMSKVGRRYAPAVMYVREKAALWELLAFLYDSISRGADWAVDVSQTTWVTDMALTAAFFRKTAAAARTDVGPLPLKRGDSCYADRAGFVFDGAGLGVWCCGSFQLPRLHFSIKLEESEVLYWNAPFNWTLVKDPLNRYPAGLRVPVWNETRVFNLHLHSKHLYLWKSSDKELDLEAVARVPENH